MRLASEHDAARAAALHAAGIPEGFLSLLGTGFLRLLYRRMSLHDGSFVLIADEDGETVGFIAGSTDVAGLYRSFLRKDGLMATMKAAGPLLQGWRRAFETLRHGRSTGAGGGGSAELLAVAVDAGSRGRGIGGSLVSSFLDETLARGGHGTHVVVAAANVDAIAMYERAGFVSERRFELHQGTESLVMRWEADAK